jgi:U3 small nucleolar ribonucleoprotein component
LKTQNYNLNSNLIQIFPATTNGYEVFSNLQEDESVNVTTKDTKTQNSNNCLQAKGNIQLVSRVEKEKHKELIMGDSHAKKCALELRHKLDHKSEVCGFIKPGTVTREIIRNAEKEVPTLKQEDVVILWTGANDISINNSKQALKIYFTS